MKRLCHLISILFAAMITLCFTITAFADDKKYDIDFTREEAYAAVMNTTSTQAKNLYGGDASYYEALTQEDKEQLFDLVWNLTENGILYDTTHTVHINSFLDDYFSIVIANFAEAASTEEGLNNLHSEIQSINEEYFSDDSSNHEKVEIIEKQEPEETTKHIQQEITTAVREPETTAQVTTIPVTEQKENNHTGLIVFLCIVAVGAAAGISYYVIQKKHQK